MGSDRLIRALDPADDLDAVDGLFQAAAAFWLMTDRKPTDRRNAEAFFVNAPPGCDSAASLRLGFFEQDRLVGLAELAFGFPESEDGYLGLMLFEPEARGRGLGPLFLAEVERLARAKGCPRLLLAVLEENTEARRFCWGQGFQPTGLSRFDEETGHRIHRLSKPL